MKAKKFLLMLAAVMCGLFASVAMTSCSSDDDKDEAPKTSTFTYYLVVNETVADYCDWTVELTTSTGKKVSGNTKGVLKGYNELPDMVRTMFEASFSLVMSEEKLNAFRNSIKVVKVEVPLTNETEVNVAHSYVTKGDAPEKADVLVGDCYVTSSKIDQSLQPAWGNTRVADYVERKKDLLTRSIAVK